MPAPERNRNFRMLDDFVTEAIHPPGTPMVAPGRARIQEMTMMEEVVHDAGAAAALDGVLKAEAVRVAALLAASPNPAATAAQFQKLLLAELAGLRG